MAIAAAILQTKSEPRAEKVHDRVTVCTVDLHPVEACLHISILEHRAGKLRLPQALYDASSIIQGSCSQNANHPARA